MNAAAPASRAAEVAMLLLLIAVSGNPAVSGPSIAPAVLLLLLAWALLAGGGRFNLDFLRRYALVASGFAAVFLAHVLQFGVISVAGSLYFLVKIFVGGLVLSQLGPRLPERLLDAVTVLCATSLLLYPLLLVLGPDAMPGLAGEDWLGANLKTVFLLTIHQTDEWWRNSSMMWEPGAFQGVVNLALVLLPASQWTQRRLRWKLLLAVVALLTTFSTTGYLVFFAIAVAKLARLGLPAALRLPLVAALATVAVIVVVEADFLGEKIVQQLAQSTLQEDFSPDRFGALVFDLHYIDKHPLFGNGLIEDTRLADHPHLHGVALGHGNGLSNFTASFGVAGLLLYFGAIVLGRSAPGLAARLGLAFVVAVIVFGEQFLGYALFLGLPFVAIAVPRPGRHRRAGTRPAVQHA